MSIIQDLKRNNQLIAFNDYRQKSNADLSGNSNNAVPNNSPYFNKYGLEINGINQNITITDNSSLSFGDGLTDNAFSIVWFGRIQKSTSPYYLVSKNPSNQTANVNEYAMWITNADRLMIRCYDASESSWIGAQSGVISIENYNMFSATYDGSSSDTGFKLYTNGLEQTATSSSSGAYTAMENLSNDVSIGRWNAYSKLTNGVFIIASKELTSTEISSLYSEIIGMKPFSRTRSKSTSSNYINTSDNSLEAYYEFNQTSGVLPDLTNNGNDMTLNGSVLTYKDDIGDSCSFSTSDSYGQITAGTNLQNLVTNGSFSILGWFFNKAHIVERHLISQLDAAGTGRTWLSIDRTDGTATWDIGTNLGGTWYFAETETPLNQWTSFCINYLQQVAPDPYGKLQIWINGVLYFSSIIDVDEGVCGDIYISQAKGGGNDFSGNNHQFLIYTRGLLEDEIAAFHNKGIVHFQAEYGVAVTNQNTTAGQISDSPFSVLSGSFKVSDELIDNTYCKVIECIGSGTFYAPINLLGMTSQEEAGHGTWYFYYYKELTADVIDFIYMADAPNIVSDASQNGYVLRLGSNNEIEHKEITAGAETSLMKTANSYFASQNWYGLKLTAAPGSNEITTYITGSEHGSNYTLLSAASGTNPFTDTSHTSSKYMVFTLSAGDKIAYAGKCCNKYNIIKKLSVEV